MSDFSHMLSIQIQQLNLKEEAKSRRRMNSSSSKNNKSFATEKKSSKKPLSVRFQILFQSFLCLSETSINVSNAEDVNREQIVIRKNNFDDVGFASSPATINVVETIVRQGNASETASTNFPSSASPSPSKKLSFTHLEKVDTLSPAPSPANTTTPLKSILKKTSSFSQKENSRTPSTSLYENSFPKSNPLSKKKSMYSRSLSVKRPSSLIFEPQEQEQRHQLEDEQLFVPVFQDQETLVVTSATSPDPRDIDRSELPFPSSPANIIVYSAEYLQLSRVPSNEYIEVDESSNAL